RRFCPPLLLARQLCEVLPVPLLPCVAGDGPRTAPSPGGAQPLRRDGPRGAICRVFRQSESTRRLLGVDHALRALPLARRGANHLAEVDGCGAAPGDLPPTG